MTARPKILETAANGQRYSWCTSVERTGTTQGKGATTVAENIIGNQDGVNGENETYRIPGRGAEIPREQLVKEVEQGRHPGFHVYQRGDDKFVRANPDDTPRDNVNR